MDAILAIDALCKVQKMKKHKLPPYTVDYKEDPKQYRKEAFLRYKARHPDKVQEKDRKYYQAHREECKERTRQWQEKRKRQKLEQESNKAIM